MADRRPARTQAAVLGALVETFTWWIDEDFAEDPRNLAKAYATLAARILG